MSFMANFSPMAKADLDFFSFGARVAVIAVRLYSECSQRRRVKRTKIGKHKHFLRYLE